MNANARSLLLGLVAACALQALDLNSLRPQGYVSDFANAVQPQTRQQLETYCYRLEQATGVQLALVTVDSLDGQPIEDVANSLFRKWGIGKKGKDEGLLLLLAVKDHKDRIEVGYGLEPILPDGFVGSVLRAMRPQLQAGDYGSALLAGAGEMGTRIAQAKGVSLDFSIERPNIPRHREPRGSIPWPLVIVGLVLLFSLFNRGGRGGGGGFLTGMILGNIFSSGGRWGGGGFGGYDGGGGGGGGFGGFGGGDSGGGGASSNW